MSRSVLIQLLQDLASSNLETNHGALQTLKAACTLHLHDITDPLSHSRCLYHEYLTKSSRAIELFHIWYKLDPLLAKDYPEAQVKGYAPKKDQNQQDKCLIFTDVLCILRCLLLHRSTQAQSICHRIFTTCRKSVLRIVKFPDPLSSVILALSELMRVYFDPSQAWFSTSTSFFEVFDDARECVKRLSYSPFVSAYDFESHSVNKQIRNGEFYRRVKRVFSLQQASFDSDDTKLCNQKRVRSNYLELVSTVLESEEVNLIRQWISTRFIVKRGFAYLFGDPPGLVHRFLKAYQENFLLSPYIPLDIKVSECIYGTVGESLTLLMSVYDTARASRCEGGLSETSLNQVRKLLYLIFQKNGFFWQSQLQGQAQLEKAIQVFNEFCLPRIAIHLIPQQALLVTYTEGQPFAIQSALFAGVAELTAHAFVTGRLDVDWVASATLINSLGQIEVDLSTASLFPSKDCDAAEPDRSYAEAALDRLYGDSLEPQISHQKHEFQRFMRTTSLKLKSLTKIILVGNSPLLQKRMLSPSLLSKRHPVIFVALHLIGTICRRYKMITDQIPTSHYYLKSEIKEVINQVLPDFSTWIAALTFLYNASGDLQLYIPEGNNDFALSPSENSMQSSSPTQRGHVAVWSQSQSLNETLSFQSKSDKFQNEQEDVLCINVVTASPEELEQLFEWSIQTYLDAFGIFEGLYSFLPLKDHQSDDLSSCLLSLWLSVTLTVMTVLRWDPLETKFNWKRFLKFSWPRKSDATQPSFLLQYVQQMLILRMLDFAWDLHCFTSAAPDTNLQPFNFEKRLVSDQMCWTQRLLHLWIHLSTTLPHDLDSRDMKLLQAFRTQLETSLCHFMTKTNLFISADHSESGIWLELLKRALSSKPNFIITLYYSVLRNLFQHFHRFYELICQFLETLRFSDQDQSTPYLSLSFFSIALLLHLAEPPLVALQPRETRVDRSLIWSGLSTEYSKKSILRTYRYVSDTLKKCAICSPFLLRVVVETTSQWKDPFHVLDEKSLQTLQSYKERCGNPLVEVPASSPARPDQEVNALSSNRDQSELKTESNWKCQRMNDSLGHQNSRNKNQDLCLDNDSKQESTNEHEQLSLELLSSLSVDAFVEKLGQPTYWTQLDALMERLTTRSLRLSRGQKEKIQKRLIELALALAGLKSSYRVPQMQQILSFWLRCFRLCRKSKCQGSKKNPDSEGGFERPDFIQTLCQSQLLTSQFQYYFPPDTKAAVSLVYDTAMQSSIIRHVLVSSFLLLNRCKLDKNLNLVINVSDDGHSDSAEEILMPAVDASGTKTDFQIGLNPDLPSSWIDGFLNAYTGSISQKDLMLRWILQNPGVLANCPSYIWIFHVSDFYETSPEASQGSWLSSALNWRHLNPHRVSMSKLFYPWSFKFASRDFQALSQGDLQLGHFLLRADCMNWVFSPSTGPAIAFSSSQKKALTDYKFLTDEEIEENMKRCIYDPSNLLSVITSRLKIAWLIVDERRRVFQNRPQGELQQYLSGCREDDPNLISFQAFERQFDSEGLWLRTVVYGGPLEQLLMGLIAQDSVNRALAKEGLIYVYSLMQNQKKDCEFEASRRRRAFLWKLASRALRRSLKEPATDAQIKQKVEELQQKNPAPAKPKYPFREFVAILNLLSYLKPYLKNDNSVSPATCIFCLQALPVITQASHPLNRKIRKYITTRSTLRSGARPFLDHSLRLKSTYKTYEPHLQFGLLYVYYLTSHLRKIEDRDKFVQLWEIASKEYVLTLLWNITCTTESFQVWVLCVSIFLNVTAFPIVDITAEIVESYGLFDWLCTQCYQILDSLLEVSPLASIDQRLTYIYTLAHKIFGLHLLLVNLLPLFPPGIACKACDIPLTPNSSIFDQSTLENDSRPPDIVPWSQWHREMQRQRCYSINAVLKSLLEASLSQLKLIDSSAHPHSEKICLYLQKLLSKVNHYETGI